VTLHATLPMTAASAARGPPMLESSLLSASFSSALLYGDNGDEPGMIQLSSVSSLTERANERAGRTLALLERASTAPLPVLPRPFSLAEASNLSDARAQAVTHVSAHNLQLLTPANVEVFNASIAQMGSLVKQSKLLFAGEIAPGELGLHQPAIAPPERQVSKAGAQATRSSPHSSGSVGVARGVARLAQGSGALPDDADDKQVAMRDKRSGKLIPKPYSKAGKEIYAKLTLARSSDEARERLEGRTNLIRAHWQHRNLIPPMTVAEMRAEAPPPVDKLLEALRQREEESAEANELLAARRRLALIALSAQERAARFTESVARTDERIAQAAIVREQLQRDLLARMEDREKHSERIMQVCTPVARVAGLRGPLAARKSVARSCGARARAPLLTKSNLPPPTCAPLRRRRRGSTLRPSQRSSNESCDSCSRARSARARTCSASACARADSSAQSCGRRAGCKPSFEIGGCSSVSTG
jgi:hypothetical protein